MAGVGLLGDAGELAAKLSSRARPGRTALSNLLLSAHGHQGGISFDESEKVVVRKNRTTNSIYGKMSPFMKRYRFCTDSLSSSESTVLIISSALSTLILLFKT